MPGDAWRLSAEGDDVARLARVLGSGAHAAILRELARARRRGEGWMYLSQLAERVGEAPGTVSVAVHKLAPFVEEKREKGLRYVRATVTEVTLSAERPPRGAK